jgi:hypothetical protein
MLLLAVDAIVLMVLLKAVNDDDIGFGTSLLIALAASIGTNLLTFALVSAMGLAGLALAAVSGAVLLGVAVSALFGVEIKRSFLIGGIFVAVHFGVAIGIQMLLNA